MFLDLFRVQRDFLVHVALSHQQRRYSNELMGHVEPGMWNVRAETSSLAFSFRGLSFLHCQQTLASPSPLLSGSASNNWKSRQQNFHWALGLGSGKDDTMTPKEGLITLYSTWLMCMLVHMCTHAQHLHTAKHTLLSHTNAP